MLQARKEFECVAVHNGLKLVGVVRIILNEVVGIPFCHTLADGYPNSRSLKVLHERMGTYRESLFQKEDGLLE